MQASVRVPVDEHGKKFGRHRCTTSMYDIYVQDYNLKALDIHSSAMAFLCLHLKRTFEAICVSDHYDATFYTFIKRVPRAAALQPSGSLAS